MELANVWVGSRPLMNKGERKAENKYKCLREKISKERASKIDLQTRIGKLLKA